MKYIHLSSDEITNRSILQWLKQWDKVVFNRKVKKRDNGNVPLNSLTKEPVDLRRVVGEEKPDMHFAYIFVKLNFE